MSKSVLIRMPLKMLPVELDVAAFMKVSLIKYIYRNSEVTRMHSDNRENDSLMSHFSGDFGSNSICRAVQCLQTKYPPPKHQSAYG